MLGRDRRNRKCMGQHSAVSTQHSAIPGQVVIPREQLSIQPPAFSPERDRRSDPGRETSSGPEWLSAKC